MKTEQHMIEKGGIREPGWHLIDLSRFHENFSSATIREACSKDVNLDKIIQRAARLKWPEVKPTNRVKQQEQETGSCDGFKPKRDKLCRFQGSVRCALDHMQICSSIESSFASPVMSNRCIFRVNQQCGMVIQFFTFSPTALVLQPFGF